MKSTTAKESKVSAETYTLRPYIDGKPSEDETWTQKWSDSFEQEVRDHCCDIGASGAHAFVGVDGPIYGPEGYEDNFCGWIDAR